MYENFVVSTQRELYLLLENHDGQIDALKFDFLLYKYGYPNDEGLGVHTMSKFGLDFYGMFQVENSEWITKLENQRSDKSYGLFEEYQHYIVTFKDVTIDILSKGFEEVKLTESMVMDLLRREIANLNVD